MDSWSFLRADLLGGIRSCVSVVTEAIERAERYTRLNAFLEIFTDESLKRAADIDEKLSNGKAGPLAGMTLAIKDNICIRGKNTTCGSHMLEHFKSVYDATVVEKLLENDVILLGRTNMDEFGMGSSGENSAFGRIRHHLDPDLVPGGSSGGSAVAVASGITHAALGSDTGGSVRQPGAFTGTYALKPTYGRVSRYGLVAFASSCDQIGTFTRSVEDSARLLQVIGGQDARDATSCENPVPDYMKNISGDVSDLTFGTIPEWMSHDMDERITEAVYRVVDSLREGGGKVTEVTLPHIRYSVPAYYVIANAEASSNLSRFDGVQFGYRHPDTGTLNDMYTNTRSSGFGKEVKRRIMLGTYVLSSGYYDAYYRKAQKVRRLIAGDFNSVFDEVDVLVAPVTPGTAFREGEKISDPLQMYLSDVFTTSANLAGIPAMSVPVDSKDDNLPIGVQLLSGAFDELSLLQTALYLEKSL